MRSTACFARRSLLTTLALLVILGSARAENSPSTAKLNKKIDDFSVQDAAGKALTLPDLARDRKAVVVVFLSFDCPVSNDYAVTLAELHKTYDAKGVAFLGICAGDVDPTLVTKQVKEYRIPFAVGRDVKHLAADALKAEVTPEAFAIDRLGYLRYRGRIDNAYAARLKKSSAVTRHDLRLALDEILAGKQVTEPATQAIGCSLPRPVETAKKDGPITYHRDVLPILQAHCQSCHRPGEVGPFSLMTYTQAVNWASDIKDYTQDRRMPPWKPVEGLGFRDERKLSDKDIATLAAWVDDGTPEGATKDAPPARTFTDGWQLGVPDLVLTVPADFTLGATGRDVFRCFVLPTDLPEDKYVTAIEVRPGNRRVVHHTLNFIDTTGQARKMEQEAQDKAKPDDLDRGPGYSVAMGVGFLPRGALGGWAPGQVSRHLPTGTGYLLPKGADVVMQVHYHRDGKVEKDRVSLGLYFAKKSPVTRFQGTVLPGRFLFIPAGHERYKVSGGIVIDQDCTLHSVMPHMHMLGREIKVTMTPPEGKAQTVVAIKDWNYNWQETYFFKQPLAVKAGTRFQVEAMYDNGPNNPNNPNNPPKWVKFGEQTHDEMCYVFFGATSDKPGRIAIRPDRGKPEEKPAEPAKP